MRRKKVTLTAETDIQRIVQYIHQDNPTAAVRYYEAALDTFFSLSDNHTPKRASDALPEHVREVQVSGFRRYTLRIAIFETETYLIAAFAPGLAGCIQGCRYLAGVAGGEVTAK